MNNDLCPSFMNVSEFGINRDMEWRKDIMIILICISNMYIRLELASKEGLGEEMES
jgi:hypothetical protein